MNLRKQEARPELSYRTIPLTKGYVAIVDIGDYELVSQFNWYAHVKRRADRSIKNVYAARTLRPATGKTMQMLHRFIMDVTDPKVEVDHEDHIGLNCRRYNLRVATATQNQQNRNINRNSTSGYKGVTWHSRQQKWEARIRLSNGRPHLGYFETSEEAAHKYDTEAVRYFGEFARLNFPLPKSGISQK